jgi:tetratricopeptide (TPR) repeat protein
MLSSEFFGEFSVRCFLFALLLISSFPCYCSQDNNLDALLEAGHFKQVARALDAKAQHDAETQYLLSKIKQSFRENDEALRLAELAVKLDPAKAKYHLQLAGVLSDQAERAGIFKKLSLAGRIRSELETAIRLEPGNTDGLFGMMIFYQEAPGIAGGSKEKARQTAEQIAEIDASMGYLAQARLALDNNEKEKLEGLYLSAVKANPRNFEALMALANYYASDSQKKYAEADRFARQALAIDSGRTGPYIVAAETAAFKQSWENLQQVLSQSEQANRDDLTAFYQAGRTLLLDNQALPRAEEYLRKYLSQPPEGFAPPLSAAHWRLALILEKEGHKDEAIKELQESLRLQPDFDTAKEDLKRLRP